MKRFFVRLSCALLVAALPSCDDPAAAPDASSDAAPSAGVRGRVGPAGATLVGRTITVVVPAGAVDREVELSIVPTDAPVPGGYTGFSPVYRASPEGITFARPLSVTLAFAGDPGRARLFWSRGGAAGYEPIDGAVIGASLTAPVTHFSEGFVGAERDAVDAGDVPDAPADVAPDAPADVAPDVPADVAADVGADAAPDAACAEGLTRCGDVCVDTGASVAHCGGCGRACAAGLACVGAVCACPAGLTLCGAGCVDTATDATNCGVCGRACGAGLGCAAGACEVLPPAPQRCAAPRALCGGACTTLQADARHCGACGRACAAGDLCVAGACAVPPPSPTLQITSLALDGCRLVDVPGVTYATPVVVGGDLLNGRDIDTLAPAAAPAYVAEVGDVRSRLFYAIAGSVWHNDVGMFREERVRWVDGPSILYENYPYPLGPAARRVALSAVADVSPTAGHTPSTTVYAGAGRVVLVVAALNQLNRHDVYDVSLATGRVAHLGWMWSIPGDGRSLQWGVAEFFGGRLYLTATAGDRIVRMRVPDGQTTVLRSFAAPFPWPLSISVARGRWLWSQVGPSDVGGAERTTSVGHCPATFAVGAPVACAAPLTACDGWCADLQSDAAHCGACGRTCGTGPRASGYCRAGTCVPFAPTETYVREAPPASATFVDACAAPGAVHVLRDADDAYAEAALPFAFPFFSRLYPVGHAVRISTNGFFSLTPTFDMPLSGPIGSDSALNGVVPYLADLVSSAEGVCVATVGTAPARRFVVEWAGSRLAAMPAAGTITTEAVLNESDRTIDVLTQSGTILAAGRIGIVGYRSPGLAGPYTLGCTSGGAVCSNTTGTRVRFRPTP